ncbi:hypothetical protein L195_g035772, partial [Trifolium pratense]
GSCKEEECIKFVGNGLKHGGVGAVSIKSAQESGLV